MPLMRTAVAVLAVALIRAVPAHAQLSTCVPPAVDISTTSDADVPANRTRVDLVDLEGTPIHDFAPRTVTGTAWRPTAEEVQTLTSAQTARPTSTLFLRWTAADGSAACRQRFRIAGVTRPVIPDSARPALLPEPGQGGNAAGTAWNEGDCVRAGSQWRQELRRQVGSDHFTEVIFLEDRGVCYRNRDFGVTGDPIFVGVFTKDSLSWDEVRVQFEPCAIESAVPSVLVSDKPSVLSGFQSRTQAWRLRIYPERTCYNTSVAVTVQGTVDGKAVTARTTVEQAQRYRATLHLGTLFTELHDRTFGLRPDGSSQRIYARGPDDRGPEYYAAVVLYALPRYLPGLLGADRYPGRDVVHEQTLLDRIGGVLGVGISDPRKQFVAGFAFEALAGVNMTGTWNFARVTRLAGVQEGDVFTGAQDRIPTRQEWDREFVLGISLDLRYASTLLSR